MRHLTSKLIPILIAIAAGGCTGSAYVVESVPAPRHEVAIYRPGHVWVSGHWSNVNSRWTWRPGYYVRERPDHVYVQGRWERRGHRYVWADGGWRPRGRVVVRDRYRRY